MIPAGTYAPVNGQDIFYRDMGSGRPIVLLHPGPSLDGSVFFPWLEPLALRHRLIAIDMPGCGRSVGSGPPDWTLEKFADAVEAFVACLGLDSYVLLGHSFGGIAALTVAIRRPPALVGLVASSTTATEAAFESMKERLERLEPAHLRRLVVAAFEREGSADSPEECRSVWADQLPFFLADPDGPLVDDLRRRWSDVVYRPDIGRHEEWGAPDLLGSLSTVEVPVLAIAGRADRAIPPSFTEAIADAVVDGHAAVIDDAGHFPFAEQRRRYVDEVSSFVADIG
jgi:proline iminopeptidase